MAALLPSAQDPAATASLEDTATAEVPRYADTVRPSMFSIYKVMLPKIMLVSLKRGGPIGVVMTSAIFMITQVIMWHVAKDSWDEVVIAIVFRLIVPMGFLYSQTSILQTVVSETVSEKESKMKIVQLVNGVPIWLYWCSYLSYFAIMATFCSIAWSIVLCATSFQGANGLLVFVGILLAYLQTFGTGVIFATFFDKLKTASHFVQLTVYIQYIPVGLSFVPNLPSIVIYLLGFLPGFSTTFWMQSVITQAVVAEAPWTWNSNFALQVEPETPPAGYLWLLSFLQVACWLGFAYWFDQVWQGEFGVAKPLTFCFQPRYMCPRRQYRIGAENLTTRTSDAPHHPLEIKNLTKVFKRGKEIHTAVDNMTLHVCTGELFALLGHNGAGKTTAINCITGLQPITSGHAAVMGYSCNNEIEQCRWNLAICPQDNPMYKELTVGQHLRFFAALRGSKDPATEIPAILEVLGLKDKLSEQCKKLSGGQQRRLWVATSLIGLAPVVFLDEPTSGMDPSSRRQLWDLLLDMKQRGRAILFTTHYLEEADLLADRKAVLAKGKVQAMGTSLELKHHFGTGYHLQVSVQKDADPACVADLRSLVKRKVGSSQERVLPEEERAQAQDAPQQLVFDLPYAEMDSIGALLNSIDDNMESLKVVDYDVAMTSLEEVFMTLGKEAAAQEVAAQGVTGTQEQGLEFQELQRDIATQEGCGKLSFKAMLSIMFKLRVRQVKAQPTIFFWTLVFPIAYLFFMYLSMSGWSLSTGQSISGGFPFVPGLCCAFGALPLLDILVRERETKVRHTMISQGLRPFAYWMGSISTIALRVLIIALAVPALGHLTSQTFLGQGRSVFLWVAALFQPAPILLFFCHFSRLFTTPEVAQKAAVPAFFLISLLAIIGPWLCWMLASGDKLDSMDTIATLLHTLLSFVSPFYLQSGLVNGLWRAGGCMLSGNAKYPVPVDADFGTWCTKWVIWAPFVGQLFLCLILSGWLKSVSMSSTGALDAEQSETVQPLRDEDVKAEEDYIRNVDPTSEACLYRDLRHTYGGGRHAGGKSEAIRAVRGISLGVRRGECFGLLGPNGAGKTTTLNCLTGEIRPPTAGEVYVAGQAVTSSQGADLHKAYQHLGYCPQVDPIIAGLTGRQHLLFFGSMKGMAPEQLDGEVDRILQRLGFEDADKDKRAEDYSGGMKRKLALAIALIGARDVLFLDEPSAAVDAGAKRLLWRVIKLRAMQQSVVITTHSMEEADAVCDRLAIQVKGVLRCLGSPLHLKTKYGSGYRVEIQLCQRSVELEQAEAQLSEFLRGALSPEVRLFEKQGNRFVYQLPTLQRGVLTLGNVFDKMQSARKQLGVQDFAVTRPSLEQVFLRFAQEQAEEDFA